jgi:hypothetical protein
METHPTRVQGKKKKEDTSRHHSKKNKSKQSTKMG